MLLQKKKILLALSILDIVFIGIGFFTLVYEVIYHHGSIIDYVFSGWFIASNLFFGLQSIAYILNYMRSIEYYPGSTDNYLIKKTKEMTAVLVPVYNEDLEMFRENISAIVNTTGNIGKIYVLDDSTNGSSEEIEKICRLYGIDYVHRTDRHGYKAGAINNVIKKLTERYIAVIDIDQMPDPDFLKEIIPIIDKDESIAYVQCPQTYTNTDASLIARMASGQQFLFYEVLTEGKSVLNTLFSCGTNVIYRKSALEEVGYFDESNITEDIATSIKILEKGYRAVYMNKKLVYGRAPTTLEGYINQQYRWAFGSLALFGTVFRNIVMKRRFSAAVRFDWLVTASWFTFGWFYFMFLIAPILDTLGIKVLSLSPLLYFFAWLPYSILVLFMFFITQMKKGGSIKVVFYNMSINVILFTMSISVTLSLLMKKKKPFITARTGGTVPWHKFWAQFILIGLLSYSAVFLFLQGTIYSYITAFWAVFDLTLLLPIFLLNRAPQSSMMDAKLFTKSG